MVIIASRAATASDPLVFPTSGAPVGGTLDALQHFLEDGDWASEDRDIILVEQRGDALAKPTLDCPELDTEHFVVDGGFSRVKRRARNARSSCRRAVRGSSRRASIPRVHERRERRRPR